VTLEALEPFRCEAPAQEPAVLPYLQEEQRYTWDVQLSCSIIPSGGAAEAVVTQTNLKYM
jgi:fumarylacetoacetase